jgi:3-deoxy-D-manno-octulosonate 8-phosphate phosphatase (KDO 8-P phosphatase)
MTYHAGAAAGRMMKSFADLRLLLLDIDGTLTNAKLFWGGPEVGWTQTFSVRDGESIRRLVMRGVPVVPLSRNGTACARVRMEGLGLSTEWIGVADKVVAFEELASRFGIPGEHIGYVADGREDVPILERVGFGCSVADAHRAARAVSFYVTKANGGDHAVEEVIDLIFEARGWHA